MCTHMGHMSHMSHMSHISHISHITCLITHKSHLCDTIERLWGGVREEGGGGRSKNITEIMFGWIGGVHALTTNNTIITITIIITIIITTITTTTTTTITQASLTPQSTALHCVQLSYVKACVTLTMVCVMVRS